MKTTQKFIKIEYNKEEFVSVLGFKNRCSKYILKFNKNKMKQTTTFIDIPQTTVLNAVIVKPRRVLCKRSLVIGDDYYFDEITDEKKPRDNRMLVKGDWYDVVYNENDNDKTFSIIDNQGCLHLHWMYTEEDKKNWPSICKDYGPRDYAKWFYTPQELEKKRQRELKRSA